MVEQNRKYADRLRGNQDIFLGDLVNSSEFLEVRHRHLKNRFIGIESLLYRIVDEESTTGKSLRACVNELAERFNLKEDVALLLIFMHEKWPDFSMHYQPYVYSENGYVYIRVSAKTTQADVLEMWKQVKEEQKKLGNVSRKASVNSELAFCIYRQYVLRKRKMKDIFDDYLNGKLEGYNHRPTIEDEHAFRKYYKGIVGGLLNR